MRAVKKRSGMTWDAISSKISEEHRRNDLKSWPTVRAHLKHLAPFFSVLVPAISSDDVSSYQDFRLNQGAARATINREVATLTHMLNLAEISHPKLRMLRGENVRQGFVSPAEFRAILAKLEPAVADFVEFLYLSVWRRGKVRDLIWDQIDFNVTPWTIRPAYGEGTKLEGSELPLTGKLKEIIERRLRSRFANCEWVFHREGKPLTDFRKQWVKHARGVLIHDLRRSGARNMKLAGVDTSVIKKRGGWRTDSMFYRYRIVDLKDHISANEAYDDYVVNH